jgi:YVTN family beta-propeller protein
MKKSVLRARLVIISLLLSLIYIPESASAAETLDYTYSVPAAQDAVFSPDGASLWVIGSSNLYKYSTSTHALLATVALSSSAYHLAITPDGSKIYAVLYANLGVAVINTATATRTSIIATVSAPYSVAASPDGAYMYVSQTLGNLMKISTSTDTAVASAVLSGTGTLRDLEVSPDGNYVYICDYTNRTLVKVNSSDLSAVSTLTLPGSSFVTLSADGSYGFVTAYVGPTNIYKFSASAMTLTGTIGGFSTAGDSEFSKDGQYLYVANAGNTTVSKLRISDSTIISTISPATGTAWHVALEPSGNFLYVMSVSGYAYVYNLGNPPTLSLSIAGTTLYRTNTTLTAVSSASSGTVTFYANGKYIAQCIKVPLSGGSAICTFKPSVHGSISISAVATSSGNSVKTSGTLLVSTRSNKR